MARSFTSLVLVGLCACGSGGGGGGGGIPSPDGGGTNPSANDNPGELVINGFLKHIQSPFSDEPEANYAAMVMVSRSGELVSDATVTVNGKALTYKSTLFHYVLPLADGPSARVEPGQQVTVQVISGDEQLTLQAECPTVELLTPAAGSGFSPGQVITATWTPAIVNSWGGGYSTLTAGRRNASTNEGIHVTGAMNDQDIKTYLDEGVTSATVELPAPYASDEEKDFAVSLDFLGEDTYKVTDAGMSRLLCATVRRVLLTGVLQ